MLHRRYYIGASGLFVVVFGAATIGLVRAGHTAVGAVFVAIGWSIVVSGLSWGLADALAPVAMLRWRAKYLAEDVNQISAAVASATDSLLDAAGDRPWESRSALRRLRLLGIGLVCLFAAMAVALWWLPGLIDAMFTTR